MGAFSNDDLGRSSSGLIKSCELFECRPCRSKQQRVLFLTITPPLLSSFAVFSEVTANFLLGLLSKFRYLFRPPSTRWNICGIKFFIFTHTRLFFGPGVLHHWCLSRRTCLDECFPTDAFFPVSVYVHKVSAPSCWAPVLSLALSEKG